MSDFTIQFGRRIKQARKLLGLTQAEFAFRCGIDESALGRYERGITQPRVQILATISTVAETSAGWLLFGGTHER